MKNLRLAVRMLLRTPMISAIAVLSLVIGIGANAAIFSLYNQLLLRPLPVADPGNAPMPFMDPAFAVAICRYDLSGGPIKLTVPVSQAYTSVSFYTRNEVAYYAINDRSAGRKVIELDLMTEEQHSALPEDEEVTAADRLIIDSPTTTGLIVLKALAPEPGLMPQAQASLAASQCAIQTEPVAAKQPEPPAPAPAPAPAPKGKR